MTERALKQVWLSWKDLAVVFASGAYLTVFYRYPIFAPDEGLILTPAERILRGQIPYRDFFSEIAPGSFYIQALLLRLGNNLACIRITIWLMGIILTWMLYRLSRELLSGPSAFAPPLVIVGICYPYIYMISHHWWGVLFYFLMLLCLTARGGQAVLENTRMSQSRLFVAGLFAAAAFLCVQPAGVFGVAAVTLWLLSVRGLTGECSWRDSFRRGAGLAFWFLLGAGALLGIAAGYFWAHGALGAWAYDNFTFLFTNYRHYETSPGVYSWVRLKRLYAWMADEPSLNTVFYFLGYYFFALVGPAIGFCGALWQIRRAMAAKDQRAGLVLLYLLAGLGALLAEIHNRDMIHLIRASPIILILMVNAWSEAFHRWGRWRRPLIFAAGLAFMFVITAAGMRIQHFANWNSPVDTRRGRLYKDPETAAAFRHWIDAVDRAVPPGGEAFFFPYHANMYYLTITRNPTRYDDLLPGFHTEQQIEEAISALQSRQPPNYVFSFDPLMVWAARDHLLDDPPDYNAPDPLEKSLQSPQSNYRKVDEVDGMEVWTLKKMNPEEYRYLYELEEDHWWYVGMRQIVAALLRPVVSPGSLRILDAGCGTGLNMRWLKRYGGGAKIFGLDFSPNALHYSRQRGERLLVRGSVDALPFPGNSFDLIISMDVVDCFSAEEAGRPFSELARVLKEDGLILLRLPAFQFLHSEHDEAIWIAHRYTAGELTQRLEQQGLIPERVTYANTLLFPIALVWRWLHRSPRLQPQSDVRPLPKFIRWLNPVFIWILEVEAAWLRRFRLPVGLSVIALARKPSSSP